MGKPRPRPVSAWLAATRAALALAAASHAELPAQVLWSFDSVERIGGHAVAVSGNPKVVATEHGPAVAFDGDGDRLLVKGNPFGEAKAYTLEVVFKPKSEKAANDAPRFLHIEVPGQPKRVIFELRFNSRREWAFDAGMTTDAGYLVLFDADLAHKGDEWAHVASTFDGATMKSFVNHKQELSGRISTRTRVIEAAAVSSIGARMNEVYWMHGLIRAVRVTHAALDPVDFLPLPGGPIAIAPMPRASRFAALGPAGAPGALRFDAAGRLVAGPAHSTAPATARKGLWSAFPP